MQAIEIVLTAMLRRALNQGEEAIDFVVVVVVV
jgi:hypothetical protein